MAMRSPIEEQVRPVTFEEYRALPDSDLRVELIRGELVMSASLKAIHQRVAFRLAIELQEHVDAQRLGEIFIAPFDVRLAGDTAVQPDILFVRSANEGRVGEDYFVGPPDLIVEVLSPSNRRIDLVRKRVLYADFGVPEYWIVDPNRQTISVNLLEGAQYGERVFERGALESSTFPDLEIDFSAIYPVPNRASDAESPNEDKANERE
jgi:Uma2 family endonuclease